MRNLYRLLSVALLIAILLPTAVFYYFVQPAAANLVALGLNDTTKALRAGLSSATDESRAAYIGQLSGVYGGRIVPDPNMHETLVEPSSRWLRLVNQSLAKLSEGKLVLLVAPGTQQAWMGIDTDQNRYWLEVPPGRISDMDLDHLLPLNVGLMCALFTFAAWVILRRYRRITQLIDAADQLERGHRPAPIPDSGPTEFRELSRAFNKVTESLRRSESENRLLLGGISHDLRTPLTSLRLGLELSRSRLEPGLSGSLNDDIDEIEAILVQFLDYARNDSDEPVSTGDLNQMVDELCGRLQKEDRRIEVALSPLPKFQYRPLAMHRMVRNMLQNAVTHGGVGISIATSLTDKGSVAISVKDRGPGIEEAQLAVIRRPFVRGVQPRKGYAGSGLGLSIVERIAQLHGGELFLNNRPEGGLDAHVELPLQPAA